MAATAGMVISFGDWQWVALGLLLFFGIFFLTHYVSLSSLSLSMEFFIGVMVFGHMGRYHMAPPALMEMYLVIAVLTGMAFFSHRQNIARLVHGKERKTYLNKRSDQ